MASHDGARHSRFWEYCKDVPGKNIIRLPPRLDYPGPAGARRAVRHERVELAVIEAARGGLMRRGLPVPPADVCLITNVAVDHLGDYGITDVPTLTDAKFLVAKAVRPGGYLVLNAGESELVARADGFAGNIFWYGLTLDGPAGDGPSAYVSDGVRHVYITALSMNRN